MSLSVTCADRFGSDFDERSGPVVTASFVLLLADLAILLPRTFTTTSRTVLPLGSLQTARSRIPHRSATDARAHASQTRGLARPPRRWCGAGIGPHRERCVGHTPASLPGVFLGRQCPHLQESWPSGSPPHDATVDLVPSRRFACSSASLVLSIHEARR